MKKKQRRLADLNPTTRRRLSLGLLRAVRRLDYHLFYAEVISGCDSDFRTIVVNCPLFDSEVPVEELPRPIVVRYPRPLSIEAWQKKYEQTQPSEIIETPWLQDDDARRCNEPAGERDFMNATMK